jgi:hypothetical protein
VPGRVFFSLSANFFVSMNSAAATSGAWQTNSRHIFANTALFSTAAVAFASLFLPYTVAKWPHHMRDVVRIECDHLSYEAGASGNGISEGGVSKRGLSDVACARTPVAPMSAATRMVRRLAANKGFIDATVGNAGMRTGGVSAPVSRRHSLAKEESRLEMKLGN